MATKAKKTVRPKRGTQTSYTSSYNPAYVRLRTIIDSLEIGAIRYFLDAPTTPQKEERLEELQGVLLPIIQWLWGDAPATIECPEGYTDCNGVCVPYPCPNLPK